MSTSTAADAAVLDALYGDLPPYRPELAEGTEVEGLVVLAQEVTLSIVLCFDDDKPNKCYLVLIFYLR